MKPCEIFVLSDADRAKLLRGETSCLNDLPLGPVAVLMDSADQDIIPYLWGSLDGGAMKSLRVLQARGVDVTKAGQDEKDGMARLCELTWRKDLPEGEPWKRVEQWLAWGGSLNTQGKGMTLLARLAVNVDNVEFVPGLMERGANPEYGNLPFPIDMAWRGALPSLTRLLRMDVPLRWDARSKKEGWRDVFSSALHSVLDSWTPVKNEEVMPVVRDFVEAWLDHSGLDPWEGQISQTDRQAKGKHPAVVEWLANAEEVSCWPKNYRKAGGGTDLGARKEALLYSWKDTMAPFIQRLQDEEWAHHEQGGTRYRGLWLAWLASDEKLAGEWVMALPKKIEEPVFMPLGCKGREVNSGKMFFSLDLSDSWLAIFRQRCRTFETTFDLDESVWTQKSDVAKNRGIDLEGRWVASERARAAHESDDGHLPENRRHRPRA